MNVLQIASLNKHHIRTSPAPGLTEAVGGGKNQAEEALSCEITNTIPNAADAVAVTLADNKNCLSVRSSGNRVLAIFMDDSKLEYQVG